MMSLKKEFSLVLVISTGKHNLISDEENVKNNLKYMRIFKENLVMYFQKIEFLPQEMKEISWESCKKDWQKLPYILANKYRNVYFWRPELNKFQRIQLTDLIRKVEGSTWRLFEVEVKEGKILFII